MINILVNQFKFLEFSVWVRLENDLVCFSNRFIWTENTASHVSSGTSESDIRHTMICTVLEVSWTIYLTSGFCKTFRFLSTSLAFLLSVRYFILVFFRNNQLKVKYLKKLDHYSSSMSMGLLYFTKLSILSLIYVSYIVLATEAKLTAMSFPGSSLIPSYT